MADSEERQKFEAWKATLMKCIGGEAGCDGSLEGLEHEPNCPLFGKQFATHFDAFVAGMRAGEIARWEKIIKSACTGCRMGWPEQGRPGDLVVVHVQPESGGLYVCQSSAIRALPLSGAEESTKRAATAGDADELE